MSRIVKKTGKVGKQVLLVYPVRVLIIINSILLPILLGILIFLLIHYAKPIEDIFDKAKQIEDIILKNINLGIDIITEYINQGKQIFDDPNIMLEFVKDILLTPLLEYINPGITQGDIDNIKAQIIQLNNFNFSNILDMAGHSVNDLINQISQVLVENGITQEQINKVIEENRSIVYILTHSQLII